MLDLCLLGCGGTRPIPGRWLTSLYIQYNGHGILIDCGEGTQIAMASAGISPHSIDLILLTHFHGDHILGLPGLLMSMGMSGRTAPVTIAVPKGLQQVVSSLCVTAGFPFQLNGIELSGAHASFDFEKDSPLHIHAFEVHHSVTCYGYSLVLDRAGRFDPVKAAALNIPKKLWNLLQKGNTVTTDTAAFTPDQVMGKPRKGIKVTYCTDTTVCDSIVPAAKDSDLFICEGMYADPARAEAAEVKKHMVFTQAAQLAKEAEVKKLWLTHFSPAETHPEEGIDTARAVFPNTELGENGKKITLNFQDDAHQP